MDFGIFDTDFFNGEKMNFVFFIIASFLVYLINKKRVLELPASVPESVAKWWPIVLRVAKIVGVPPQIILAQIWQESSGISTKIGKSGEVGLMQLKAIAVKDLELEGIGNFSDYKENPYTNILAGAYYLKLMKKRTKDEGYNLALGAYNQGVVGSRQKPELAAEYVELVTNKLNQINDVR